MRSTTLTLTLSSRLRSWLGASSPSHDHGVGAGGAHDLGEPLDLAAADVGGGVGAVAALVERVEHLRAGGLGEQRRARPCCSRRPATEPSVQTPTRMTRSSRSWRYSTSVMSSSSVDEPGDAAQRVALGEVELAPWSRREWSGFSADVVVPVGGVRQLLGEVEVSRVRSSYGLQPSSTAHEPANGYRAGLTTRAEPPPRRVGSETAVMRPGGRTRSPSPPRSRRPWCPARRPARTCGRSGVSAAPYLSMNACSAVTSAVLRWEAARGGDRLLDASCRGRSG